MPESRSKMRQRGRGGGESSTAAARCSSVIEAIDGRGNEAQRSGLARMGCLLTERERAARVERTEMRGTDDDICQPRRTD